jgi:hypothetical protein
MLDRQIEQLESEKADYLKGRKGKSNSP